MPDYVRLMRREDIDQVIEVDREAFPTEWPPPNFKRDMENRLARYVVACNAATLPVAEASPPPSKGLTGLIYGVRRLFIQDRLPENRISQEGTECITGFAGFWIMVDESHITSIATRQDYRRQGIGELLLQSVIDISASRKARIVTLEVRASNSPALQLYAKYGFRQVGLRRGYYTDNREDAIIMSTDPVVSPPFQAQLRELKKAYTTKWGPDRHRLDI